MPRTRMPSNLPFRIAALWMAIASGASAVAALPEIDRLEPLGVVRGEESTVVFHGQRIKDAHQVLTDEAGIEVLSVKPLDNRKVEVRLRADASLAPGLYPVRLVTKSGIANLRLLGVGTMPIVKETEPNNEFDAAQPIELNRTIEGTIEQEDVDHFRVKLDAGEKLTVEIEGIRLAYSLRNRDLLDPYVAILDEGRFELATSDDSALHQQDGLCTYTAEEAGEYTVLVRDSSFGGSDNSGYRLHVGSFPRPVAVMPGGGTPGSLLEATLIDVDGSARQATFQLPSQAHDRWGAITESDRGISPSPNWIRVNELPSVLEQEPNDDRTKAPESEVPAAFCGVIQEPGDFDCFAFQCKKGQRFHVQVYARDTLRSPLDGVLNVFGPDNRTLQSSDDNQGAIDPYVQFTAKEDGRHSVRIYDHLRGGSDLHQYRIEVTPMQPEFDLALKELRRDQAQVASIPIGGSIGVVVQAQRRNYGGPIEFDLQGLPKGVTATTFDMPQGRSEIPILLTALADAEKTASLFDIYGKGGDDFSVRGQLEQTHKLVLGQNRRHMWSYTTDRAAAAVTDEAPFSIELVQPNTPLVRNGSKNLTVRIKRDDGFEGQVSLRTLYNPPGVGINNSRRIAKEESEASIPITANRNAAVGEWPLVMVASYGTDNGTAYIATNAIMLDVQEELFSYKFPRTAAELGAESAVTLSMEVLREYEGQAEVQLVGMPNGVTSPAPTQPIKPDSDRVSFPIVVAEDAKVGKHKTLNVQSRVTVGDEVIVQTTGTGELRIDKPLEAAEAKSEPKKKEAAKNAAAPKPLSRLEQLRQQKFQSQQSAQ